jgi:hypothetical protein
MKYKFQYAQIRESGISLSFQAPNSSGLPPKILPKLDSGICLSCRFWSNIPGTSRFPIGKIRPIINHSGEQVKEAGLLALRKIAILVFNDISSFQFFSLLKF